MWGFRTHRKDRRQKHAKGLASCRSPARAVDGLFRQPTDGRLGLRRAIPTSPLDADHQFAFAKYVAKPATGSSWWLERVPGPGQFRTPNAIRRDLHDNTLRGAPPPPAQSRCFR